VEQMLFVQIFQGLGKLLRMHETLQGQMWLRQHPIISAVGHLTVLLLAIGGVCFAIWLVTYDGGRGSGYLPRGLSPEDMGYEHPDY